MDKLNKNELEMEFDKEAGNKDPEVQSRIDQIELMQRKIDFYDMVIDNLPEPKRTVAAILRDIYSRKPYYARNLLNRFYAEEISKSKFFDRILKDTKERVIYSKEELMDCFNL